MEYPATYALTDGTNNSEPHGFSEILGKL